MEMLSIKARVRLIICTLLILSSFQLKAQIFDDSDCPMPKETFTSKYYMESFLVSVNDKDKRVASGTENIPFTEVQPVDDEAICLALQNIIQSNTKYKSADENTKLRKHFYKSNKFYFVFWNFKRSGLGRRLLFLVIKKDFSKTYEFYL